MRRKLLVAAVIAVMNIALSGCDLFGILSGTDRSDTDRLAAELSRIDENLSVDSESGVIFVSNEIILMASEGCSEDEIKQLAEAYGAEIKDSLPDIGVYKLVFPERMVYEEILQLIERLKAEPSVEDAFENPVAELKDDAAVSAYPFDLSDPWYGDAVGQWTVSAPSGSNWGMEAINAPAAWAHLPEMADVNVALIDTFVDTSGDIGNIEVLTSLTAGGPGTYVASDIYLSPDDHGTHVAGIMAAGYDNGIGVTGVMGDKVELYYANAVRYAGEGEIYTDAYDYLVCADLLVRNNIKVINVSQHNGRLIGFAAARGNDNAINYLKASSRIVERGLKRLIESGYEFVICSSAGNNNNIEYIKDDSRTYGYREKGRWDFKRGDSGDVDSKYNSFFNLIDDDKVKERIVVVGSVKMDDKASTGDVRYAHSAFSNIGSRVDIVAPGEDIYSTVVKGYAFMDGTSMAAPHVSGVAGLIFACNPDLTGAEVKQMLLMSAVGRYYYTGGHSGLLNAGIAVENALLTKDNPVERILARTSELDVCFVIDTTGSMSDDIQNARENMNKILENIETKSNDFRVALVDYRDYPERTGVAEDYASRLQLGFSADNREITSAIEHLQLGDGGDIEETVYSGLMQAASLDWRAYAQKVIVILGDAAPLDPEPVTGYTFDDVLTRLNAADISIDIDSSDYEVIPESAFFGKAIKVFSIGTDASYDAVDFFNEISAETGGYYTEAEDASEVSDAIISSIAKIETLQRKTIDAIFGTDYAGAIVELYRDSVFLFEFPLDKTGRLTLENMDIGSYKWSIPALTAAGDMYVSETNDMADILILDGPSGRTEEIPVSPLKAIAIIIAVVLASAMAVILAVAANSRRMLPEAEGGAFAKAYVSPESLGFADVIVESSPATAAVIILHGSSRGTEIPLQGGEIVKIGRDRDMANIVITENADKVSRLHCTVSYKADDDCYYVTDLSHNGTFLADMTPLPRKTRVVLGRNTVLYLADRACGIVLK
jgi:subtilisin family serine protease